MKLFEKKPMPLPETLSDCLLLQQMGYETIIEDGKAAGVKKIKGHFSKRLEI